MSEPGSRDGELMVQLAQWGTMLGVEDAHSVVFADDFAPETAAATDGPVSRLLMWGETLGTLTKNGLVSTELILDWIWIGGLWARLAPAARAAREEHGQPKLYENFEALANAQGS